MEAKELTDLEKLELLQLLLVHRINAAGSEGLIARIAESVSSHEQREIAITMASRYLTSLGKREEAETLIHRHLTGAVEATALALVGTEIIKSNPSEGAAYLQQARNMLHEVEDAEDRVPLLQHLVDGYLTLNQNSTAWDLAKQISNPSERVYTLVNLAKQLWDKRDVETAERVLLDARASVGETTPSDRADTLDDIARLLAHMGRETDALNAWEEAVKFADESPDPPKLLLMICTGLTSIGLRERAREIAMLIQNDARKAQALETIGQQ